MFPLGGEIFFRID